MSEEELTPFGEALKEIAAKRGMTLEELLEVVALEAFQGGGQALAQAVVEDALTHIYKGEGQRRRREVLEGRYGDLGYGGPN